MDSLNLSNRYFLLLKKFRQTFHKENTGIFDRVNNSHNEEIFRDVKEKININKQSDEKRRKQLGLDFLNKMNSNDLKKVFLKGKFISNSKENGMF